MKKIVMALAATLMAMTAQVAPAATSFSFSFSGPTTTGTPGNLSGSGYFLTEDGVADPDTGALSFLITGAGGSVALNGGTIATIAGLDATAAAATNLIVELDGDIALVDTVLGTSRGFLGIVLNEDPLDGTYNISFADLAASGATLSIAAIPEPATWAMMLLGFAVVAAALRRRRPALLAA